MSKLTDKIKALELWLPPSDTTALATLRGILADTQELEAQVETARQAGYSFGRKAGIASVAAVEAVNIVVVQQAKREAYEHVRELAGQLEDDAATDYFIGQLERAVAALEGNDNE